MIFGLAKPTLTWNPAGPNSWKEHGSPNRRNESWAFWPSRVLVWSHSSPRAIRSAPGVATTPYLPGIRLATTAWPASRSEEHTSELQSRLHLVCRLLLEKKKKILVVAVPTTSLVGHNAI